MLVPDIVSDRLSVSVNYSHGGSPYIFWDFGNIGGPGRLSYALPSATLNTWEHYVFTSSVSQNSKKVYRNGTLLSSSSSSDVVDNIARSLRIGSGNNGNYFNGAIDDVHIYNRPLTASEVTTLYNGVGISGPSILCAGESATLTASSGTSYLWSTSATTQSITVTSAGTYNVTITNATGTVTASKTVTLSFPPTPAISGPSSFCSGNTATLTASGGVSYLWSTGATSASINITTGGSYTVTVSNSSGCKSATTKSVTLNASPTASISGPSTYCAGSGTLTASGGTSYLWNTGETTASISPNTSGTYSVTVTGSNGCTATANKPIAVNAVPVASISGPSTICSGSGAVLTASGGVAYSWSTGATTASITVTSAGTYTVTVTNGATCTATASRTLTVSALPTASISGPTTFCVGNGTLTASGGATYLWSTGATTASINPATSGTYQVTVTNSAGCTATAGQTVTVNPLPAAAISGPATRCSADPAVTLTASGGTSYLWYNGTTNTSITATAGAVYRVTVTNSAGCTATASHTLTVYTSPTASITASGPTSFCGSGTVTLTASGGTSYIWNPGGASTSAITVTPASTTVYTVTVSNSNGCSATTNRTVTVNPIPTASVTGPSVFCSGSGILTASGGTSYLWSTGATTTTISPTASGTYWVTVTNSGGCTATANKAVTVNPLPTASISGPASRCTNDPAAILTASGGTSYLWQHDGSTTASVSVINGATYRVTVTNANGCTATATHLLNLYTSPTASISASGATAFCDGGSVTLTGSGGVSYLWSPGGATTSAITVSTGATYTVQVSNANGCTATANRIVTVYPLPTASITASGPVTFCSGANVTLTASGGNTYAWSTSSSNASITVSSSGTYTVTVTNSNGCKDTESQTVTVNPTPTITLSPASYNGYNVSCNGGSNGSVSTSVSQGTSPFGFIWSNGSTSQNQAGLSAGSYSVTVSDSKGCTDTRIVALTEPSLLQANAGPSRIACYGSAVTLGGSPSSGSGGVAPYTYLWSPGAATSSNPIVSPVTETTYTLKVTDANGCTKSGAASISVNPQMFVDMEPMAFDNCGRNYQKYLGYGPEEVQLGGIASGGSGVYSYSWSPASTVDNPSGDYTLANPGVTTSYTLVVTDLKGCTVSGQSVVNVLDVRCGQDLLGNPQVWVCTGSLEQCMNKSLVSGYLMANPAACVGPCSANRTGKFEEAPADVTAFEVSAYPNPFSDRVQLEVLTPSGGFTRLEIIDVLGKIIADYKLESVTPGKSVFTWNGTDLTGAPVRSGIYLCRVIHGEETKTVRLSIQR
jgi:large repetitive protein